MLNDSLTISCTFNNLCALFLNIHPRHPHSHHASQPPPAIHLCPPRRAGRPRAHRLPAGETPSGWRAAAGRDLETEAYSQEDPACHGYRRRSPSNITLFGKPGRFYMYVSYGIHYCVKRARLSTTLGWA